MRRKRPIQKKPQTIEKMVIRSHVDNYLNCKWIKCTNQKTQTGWADQNMCIYALPLTTSLYLIPKLYITITVKDVYQFSQSGARQKIKDNYSCKP